MALVQGTKLIKGHHKRTTKHKPLSQTERIAEA